MRKYVQVILVVLSVFSLVSLLVYRHEYYKLRYVLEVLNFFGSPVTNQTNQPCYKRVNLRHYPSNHPPPAWQRVSNTVYVYSAYWNQHEDKLGVKAVAIGVLSENVKYGCYLWYNEQSEPVQGIFSFAAIPRKNQKIPVRNTINSKYFSKGAKNKGFLFHCDPSEPVNVPFGVTFYNKNNDDTAQAYIPVSSFNFTSSTQNGTAICIMPSETPFYKKLQYLEFLVFHSMLGANEFFVYGGEYLFNVLTTLQDVPDLNVAVQSLQWNYPFVSDYDLMKTVAESDCLLRTKGVYSFAIPLSWGQFLAPKFHSNINIMLHDFDPLHKIPKFSLSVVLFCLEYKDDPKSSPDLPLMYRKTRFALPKPEINVIASRQPAVDSSAQKMSREVVAVHWYTKCDYFDLKPLDKTKSKFDYTMLKFHSKISAANGHYL